MTTREEILERIAKMDDAALPALLEMIERLERRRRNLSPDFLETLADVHRRKGDLSEAEALDLATETRAWLDSDLSRLGEYEPDGHADIDPATL